MTNSCLATFEWVIVRFATKVSLGVSSSEKENLGEQQCLDKNSFVPHG